MELSTILNGISLYGGSNAIGEQVSSASRKSLARLSQQADSTRVQLSAFGQVKSATAQLQTVAEKLQDNRDLGSTADVTKAVQAFADSFNKQLNSVRQIAQTEQPAGAVYDLRRAVAGSGASNQAALQQIGISFGKDGGLAVDAKALQKAFEANPDQVRQTLSRVGQAVGEASARQLSANGAVGGAVDRLSARLSGIEQKQSGFEASLEASQKAVQAADQRASRVQFAAQQAFSFNGAAAYFRIFNS